MSITGRLVLIGEPDQATTALYQRALRAAFDVIAAADERAIRRALRSQPIAALVLEPALFGASAWEPLVTIGRECARRGIPFVICSTLDERRRGFELGAAAYLLKPTLPATLLDTLQRVTGTGRI